MNKRFKTFIFLLLTFIIYYPFFKLSQIKITKNHKFFEGEIKKGDTIGDILKRYEISGKEYDEIILKLKEVFNPEKSKIGDIWQLYFDKNNKFLKFRYFNRPFEYCIVERDPKTEDFFAYKEKIPTYRKTFYIKGNIKNSLYESMTNLKINPEIIIQFAEIFESKLDFLTDCQNGDSFSIIWESLTDKDGNILKDIKVIAGKYENTNQKFYGFYFEKEEIKGYFDENGKGLESGFLKAPLSYRKITSFFSKSRFHPIYKVYRPHLGIDYSAPVGTPVSAIGNGVVIFSGYLGGYGNCIKIKHPNGYISYYGHLSKFEKNIKKGVKVKKGEVIGYVGMTGIATGPHLDFRIKKDGKFINFLKIKFVPEKNIPEKYKKDFEKIKNLYIKYL
ncbi:MAG: M23 family metallopeptidase [Candidatus Omnitrophica bacterium]|nr:M23 family metallopeptidase [Candidatus Omnitrophota bacterium]